MCFTTQGLESGLDFADLLKYASVQLMCFCSFLCVVESACQGATTSASELRVLSVAQTEHSQKSCDSFQMAPKKFQRSFMCRLQTVSSRQVYELQNFANTSKADVSLVKTCRPRHTHTQIHTRCPEAAHCGNTLFA